jgi:hypothetical protein
MCTGPGSRIIDWYAPRGQVAAEPGQACAVNCYGATVTSTVTTDQCIQLHGFNALSGRAGPGSASCDMRAALSLGCDCRDEQLLHLHTRAPSY